MHEEFHVSLLRPYYFEGEGVPPAVLPTRFAEFELEGTLQHEDDADNVRF